MRPHRVFTLPLVSVLSTAKAEVCGRMMYGDLEIEDLWIPFFCVSSNLTTAEMVVHRRGSLLRAATASASLPGIAPPVLEGCQLLVDGALLNNLPSDVMRQLGAGVVIASEVSVEEDAAFTCDRVPTPRQVLKGRLLRRPVRFPSLMEVVMRASLLHSVYREREAMELADLCLRPPIDAFGLMEFDALESIVAAGYEYARTAVPAWVETGAAGPSAAGGG
jgi:NTE family protein